MKEGHYAEYSPKFVDVIIQRWENYTGKKTKKLKF